MEYKVYRYDYAELQNVFCSSVQIQNGYAIFYQYIDDVENVIAAFSLKECFIVKL